MFWSNRFNVKRFVLIEELILYAKGLGVWYICNCVNGGRALMEKEMKAWTIKQKPEFL